MKPSFGLDLFGYPFGPIAGYAFIENPSVRLLILRNETLDRWVFAVIRFACYPARMQRREVSWE